MGVYIILVKDLENHLRSGSKKMISEISMTVEFIEQLLLET